MKNKKIINNMEFLCNSEGNKSKKCKRKKERERVRHTNHVCKKQWKKMGSKGHIIGGTHM